MNNRLLAIALGTVATACLIFASFSHRWLFNARGSAELGFGLRDNYTCQTYDGADHCEARTNSAFVADYHDEDSHISGAFVPMGWATLVACLIAAVGLAGAVVIAIARKHPDPPIAPTTIALLGLMACLITGCVFVATKPSAAVVGVGFGFWAFGAGAVLGLAASLMLAKVNRPVDPDLMEDAMNPDQF